MGSSIPHQPAASGWPQGDPEAGGGEAGGGHRNSDLVSEAAGNSRSNTITSVVFMFMPFYTKCISFTIPLITVGKLDFGAKNSI